ncbi:hypothetical protein B0O99DRAFT_736627 [Bisporella sp. PMI_857]|nr:hypothetical protein B0O99DRAFT_736627 [Bisporella sp. PMI_857]
MCLTTRETAWFFKTITASQATVTEPELNKAFDGPTHQTVVAGQNKTLTEAAEKSSRDVGALVLFMVTADETDAEAEITRKFYREGADVDALTWMVEQGSKVIKSDLTSTVTSIHLPESAVNLNMGTLLGGYTNVAEMIDEVAELPETKGITLIFNDFLESQMNLESRSRLY